MAKIKYICVFLGTLIFTLSFIRATAVYAAEDSANMSASVNVNSVFEMGVFPTSLDFPAVDPAATTATKEITLLCSTNNDNPWTLEIYDMAELSSGTFTIPNDNLNWWGWSAGSGTWHAGMATMSTMPFTFYEGGMNEYMTSALEVHLSFNVDIPSNQEAGTYTTTIIVKMRDASTLEEIEATLNVSVEVNPRFTMSLSETNLNFGTVNPDVTTETKSLSLFYETNNNNPWEARISVVSPLTSETFTVPNENFNWWGWTTNGSGTWNAGSGHVDIIPHTFYYAGPDEAITSSPVEVTLQFNIKVPADQVAGAYATTLVITMTE